MHKPQHLNIVPSLSLWVIFNKSEIAYIILDAIACSVVL